jgi:hypothetical protein
MKSKNTNNDSVRDKLNQALARRGLLRPKQLNKTQRDAQRRKDSGVR